VSTTLISQIIFDNEMQSAAKGGAPTDAVVGEVAEELSQPSSLEVNPAQSQIVAASSADPELKEDESESIPLGLSVNELENSEEKQDTQKDMCAGCPCILLSRLCLLAGLLPKC